LHDGQSVNIREPRIVGGSIRSELVRPVAIAEIRSAESPTLHKGRTVALLAGVGLVTAGIVFLATADFGSGGSGGTIGFGF
jgi:hypothetical protein